jgi:Xaa-Pro aminopeptidase
MSNHLSAEFYKANRQRLQTLFTGSAPIVLTANGLLQKSTDTTYPFHQDGNFRYMTGLNEPNLVLVIDKGKEYLIVPELSEVRIKFDGQTANDEMTRISGIEEIVDEKEGWRRLSARLKRAGNVAVIAPAPAFIDQLGMYTNPSKKLLVNELKKHNPELTLLDLRVHFQRMRMVKSAEEIEAIQQAIDITSRALKKVRNKYYKSGYQNEFEIEQDLTKNFYADGGEGHSFEPIIAAGDKATVIHAVNNHNPIDDKQPLLLDVGAVFAGYAADISRSWNVSPTKRYRAVHAAVVEVCEFAMNILKPGVILQQYEKEVEHFMGEKLRELGLIKSIESEEVRKYFPHATSHFLGIDVHDVGDYELPLEANVVLTVEPGIYIPEEGIGIRIEDDVIITEDGARSMSSNLSADIEP